MDQIEELDLPGKIYARIMAETLAQLYWNAHIDANDIEFVLAPVSPQNDEELQPSAVMQSPFLGDHSMWILDFDCCRDMSMDEGGVEQAVAAFYRNDPFYPRPGRDNDEDQALWEEFRDRFLEASAAIWGDSQEAGLPALWVKMVERKSQT